MFEFFRPVNKWRRVWFVALMGLLTWLGFKPQPSRAWAQDTTVADREFQGIADEFLTGYFDFRPQSAASLGLHEYDGNLTDFRHESLDRELERLKRFERRLAEIPIGRLSASSRYDLTILLAGIREELFDFEGKRSYWRNPLTYPRVLHWNDYLSRDYAPLETRVKAVVGLARQTPMLFAAARANLEPVLPRPFVETAIRVTQGAAQFLSRDLPVAVQDLKDGPLLVELHQARDEAERELRSFAQWLETERLPQSHHRFALGRDSFAKMLRDLELVTVSPEEIFERGWKEIQREQDVFNACARIIDPTKPAMDVFRAIQSDHPTAENLIPDTRRNLEAIRQFVVDRRIVTMPSEVRAIVAETPAFRRATSFASMDSPGPFERRATEAYYYVTPADRGWTAEKQHEWLTAFNDYTTDVVSIHEAYPGHYVQHLHANASPVHRLRKIFSSYAFVEGWAHYTEQMVLDEGFPGDGDPVRTAKYRMAQADESLLRLCRLCVSIQMHCGEMTVDDATRFFQEHCHYQEQPARQEAVRGTYDAGYLHYALGKLMILKLREDWRLQEADRYSLQRFHDTLLRQGMPPLPLLRQMMLTDPKSWNAAL